MIFHPFFCRMQALEDQAKIDQATIEDLRRQLAELQRLYAELMRWVGLD